MRDTVIFPSLTGTTVMTIFSYFVSELAKENYREPELLSFFIMRFFPAADCNVALYAGWVIHYLVGIIFIIIANVMLINRGIMGTYFRAGLFGAACGVVGIIVWNILRTVEPSALPANMYLFSIQLLIAHIIFGVFTWIALRGVARRFPEF